MFTVMCINVYIYLYIVDICEVTRKNMCPFIYYVVYTYLSIYNVLLGERKNCRGSVIIFERGKAETRTMVRAWTCLPLPYYRT